MNLTNLVLYVCNASRGFLLSVGVEQCSWLGSILNIFEFKGRLCCTLDVVHFQMTSATLLVEATPSFCYHYYYLNSFIYSHCCYYVVSSLVVFLLARYGY